MLSICNNEKNEKVFIFSIKKMNSTGTGVLTYHSLFDKRCILTINNNLFEYSKKITNGSPGFMTTITSKYEVSEYTDDGMIEIFEKNKDIPTCKRFMFLTNPNKLAFVDDNLNFFILIENITNRQFKFEYNNEIFSHDDISFILTYLMVMKSSQISFDIYLPKIPLVIFLCFLIFYLNSRF